MVHGPCGDINPNYPCMTKCTNGELICSKRFPEALIEETQVNEDGYPRYKRTRIVDPDSWYSTTHPLRRVILGMISITDGLYRTTHFYRKNTKPILMLSAAKVSKQLNIPTSVFTKVQIAQHSNLATQMMRFSIICKVVTFWANRSICSHI
jgi:hypothetical protein